MSAVDAVIAPLSARLESLESAVAKHATKEENARLRVENAQKRYEEIKAEGADNKAEVIRLANAIATLKGEPLPYPPKPPAATAAAPSASSGTTAAGLPKGKRRPGSKTVKRLTALHDHLLTIDGHSQDVRESYKALKASGVDVGSKWNLLRDSTANCGYLFGISVGADNATMTCDPAFSNDYVNAAGQQTIPGADGDEGDEEGSNDEAGGAEDEEGSNEDAGAADGDEGGKAEEGATEGE